ncbi:MAG TPA: RNA polymerase sigma factor [Polyangia bacterium]|nr:RNA polymerase sigma factor [Polyangia bacterium]
MSHSLLLRASDQVSDTELVSRALAGDRWGREMLYRRHAGRLLGLTTRLLGNRGDAEEIVQDTFITGFAQLASLREPGAVGAWLGQIAISLVRRRIRRARLLRRLGLDRGADDATLEALGDPGLSPEERTDLALVDRALGSINAVSRIAWMLRRVEGLPLAEVATMCDCSLATAKRRITEADRRVAEHVGGEWGEP